MDPATNDQTQNQDATNQPQPTTPPVADPPQDDPSQPMSPPQAPVTDDSAGLPAPVPGSTTAPDQSATGLPGVENAQIVEPPADQPGPEVASDVNTPPADITGDNPGDAPAADQNQNLGSF